jgi:hypothetical protein
MRNVSDSLLAIYGRSTSTHSTDITDVLIGVSDVGVLFSYDGADTHGPIHCVPTPEWLKEHPDDDRKER